MAKEVAVKETTEGTVPPIISAIDHMKAALEWMDGNKPMGNHPSRLGHDKVMGQLRTIIFFYESEVLALGASRGS